MSPFEQALLEEEKWLARVIDQSPSTDPNAGRRVYIGPTKVDMSAAFPVPQKKAMPERPRIPPNEQANLKKWRAASLDYLHGHRGCPRVVPALPIRSF